MSLAETRQYKISHYAKADLGEDGFDKLEKWMQKQNVVFDSEEVYSVDIATAQLTPAHYEAIKAGEEDDYDLNSLVSMMFSQDEVPSWLESGESLGEFEMEIRVGMGPLHSWCTKAGVDQDQLEELIEEMYEGAGSTDSTWIEDAASFQ